MSDVVSDFEVKRALMGVWEFESKTLGDGTVIYTSSHFMEMERTISDGEEHAVWRIGKWDVENGALVWRMKEGISAHVSPHGAVSKKEEKVLRARARKNGEGITFEGDVVWTSRNDVFTICGKDGSVSVWRRIEKL